ncbi:hypothetical protein, partial [Roseisolibacter sp. H3M3-2]|uniref:hypothetical protein n=1 Tax=Roseisolibacter sp. H3M3-2 TaxID=3031323 RepID=UPI0023DCCBE3
STPWLTERHGYDPTWRGDAALPAKCRVALAAGEVLTIETPAGGGWGTAAPPPHVGRAPRDA